MGGESAGFRMLVRSPRNTRTPAADNLHADVPCQRLETRTSRQSAGKTGVISRLWRSLSALCNTAWAKENLVYFSLTILVSIRFHFNLLTSCPRPFSLRLFKVALMHLKATSLFCVNIVWVGYQLICQLAWYRGNITGLSGLEVWGFVDTLFQWAATLTMRDGHWLNLGCKLAGCVKLYKSAAKMAPLLGSSKAHYLYETSLELNILLSKAAISETAKFWNTKDTKR